MAIGDYDEDEHERREQKTATVDAAFDDERTSYEGTVEYESGESAEALIDQFKRLQN